MLNVHPSLLPRWRGPRRSSGRSWPATRRPASRSCARPRASTRDRCAWWARSRSRTTTTTARCPPRLEAWGADLVIRALDERPEFVEQPSEGVTYAEKIGPEDRRAGPGVAERGGAGKVVRALNPAHRSAAGDLRCGERGRSLRSRVWPRASWRRATAVCCSGPPTARSSCSRSSRRASGRWTPRRTCGGTGWARHLDSIAECPLRHRPAPPPGGDPRPCRRLHGPAPLFEHGAWADRALHAAAGALSARDRRSPPSSPTAPSSASDARPRRPAARRTPRRPARPTRPRGPAPRPVPAALPRRRPRPRRRRLLGPRWPTAMPRGPPASSTRSCAGPRARSRPSTTHRRRRRPRPLGAAVARRALVRRARRRRGPTAPPRHQRARRVRAAANTLVTARDELLAAVPGTARRTTRRRRPRRPLDAHGHPLFDAGAYQPQSRGLPARRVCARPAARRTHPRPVCRAGRQDHPHRGAHADRHRRRRRAPLRPGRPAHPLRSRGCAPRRRAGRERRPPPTRARRPLRPRPRRPAVQRPRHSAVAPRPRWHATPEAPLELQARILDTAAAVAARRLVYSTCTISKRENADQVAASSSATRSSRCPTSASRSLTVTEPTASTSQRSTVPEENRRLGPQCPNCGEPWLRPTNLAGRYRCVYCLHRYELRSVCPNCGEHSTIVRMSSTATTTCQSCGDSMLLPI